MPYYLGGHHPTHLGDTFKDGRYTVVHKLGIGTFSAVWLVNDSNTKSYVALKVLAADAAKWSENLRSVDEELEVLSRIRDNAHATGSDGVVRLLDHFLHTGPNGTHQCIVTELLGPDIASAQERGFLERLPWSVRKSMIRQVSYAIRFLHRNNIVHGDLHVQNILLSSHKLSSMSDGDDITRYFGKAYTNDMDFTDDSKPDNASLHPPLYHVCLPDTESLLRLCFSDPSGVCVKICDFGESSILSEETQPKWANIPNIYQAPEVTLRQPCKPAFAADIWALAALFYFIATEGLPLFAPGSLLKAPVSNEVLKEIVLRVGKLPEPLWSEWGSRAKYFDEDGRSTLDGKQAGTEPLISSFSRIPDGEDCILFEQMLRSMLELKPEMRATIDDVINSEWFVKYCAGDSEGS